jgi:hypothetical protein
MFMSAEGWSGPASSVLFRGLVSEADGAVLMAEAVVAAIVRAGVVMADNGEGTMAQDIYHKHPEAAQARAADTGCGGVAWLVMTIERWMMS